MKTTEYFKYRRTFPDRISITDVMIIQTIQNPCRKLIQFDSRIRLWSKIETDKYLRVILMEDEETVHNAFYDRTFKE